MPKYEKVIIFILVAFLLMCFGPAALADETIIYDKGLTIEQAIDKAITYSKTLQQHDLDIEKAEAQRESLVDAVKFIPLGASGSTKADQAYIALVGADISWAMAKKAKNIDEDKIALATFKAYIGVLEAQENLLHCKNALEKAQVERGLASLKHQQGMINALENNVSDTQYSTAQKGYHLAEIQLTTAYQALNKLIGNRVEEQPVLGEKPAYNQMIIDEIEAAVNRTVQGSPSLWLAGQNVDLAKLELSLFDWTKGNNNTYRVAEISKEKAEMGTVEARSELRQAIRDIYHNILALEDAYSMQREAVKLAEDNLGVKILMNSVGLGTGLEVKTAELDLQKARNELDSIIYQHEYLKLVFEKPWAGM